MQYCIHGDLDEQHGYATSHVADMCQVTITHHMHCILHMHSSHAFLFEQLFKENGGEHVSIYQGKIHS